MKKRIFPSFCKALTVFAYSFIAAQFTYVQLIARDRSYTESYALIYTLVFVAAGYFLQALVGFLFRFKRSEDTGLSLEKFISLPHLLLPVILALVAGTAFALQKRAEMLAAFKIDVYSLAPFGYGFLIFVLMLFGILIWFIPFGKLMTKQSLTVVGLIYLGAFVFTPFIGVQSHSFIGVGYLVFVAAALFLINQASLEKYFRSVGGVSLSTRRYNALIAAFLLCCILLTMFVVVGVISGGISLAKSVIASALRPDEEEFEQDDEYIIVGDSAPKKATEFTLQPIPSLLRAILFAILFISVFIFFLMRIVHFFRYNRSESKFGNILLTVFEAIKDAFFELIELLSRLFGSKFTKPIESNVPMSYHEERISLADISSYEKTVPAVRSYADFKNKLDRISDPAERYRFAYSVMLKLAGDAYSLKSSDTPREASRFLAGKGWNERIYAQSTDYELTAYSSDPPPEERLEGSIEEICYKVRAML